MSMEARREMLISMGFDKTHIAKEEGKPYVHVGCSQCNAVCVNGHPIHERGCPHEMGECKGCNAIIPKNQRYCEECQ